MNFESLSDLTTYLQRGISPKYAESGVPVINQKCIRGGQLKSENIKFHGSDKTYSQEKELRKDDILVNSTGVGTLGRVARFSNEEEKMLADSHVTIVRPDAEKIFPLYLFYVLRFNEKTIVELGAGSTGQTELSRIALGSLQIPIPSQGVQKYIADTLAYIDKKIDTNETLSKTLEDIAQTIFKSWFIDFDPVMAKMVGEKPAGMDAATAAIFPDSMEESELGMIPKGWEISKSTDLFDVLSGGTPKTANENYWNGDVPWFSVVDAPDSGGCFFIKTNKTITKEGLENSAAQLVRPGVTIISARGTVGKTAIVAIPSTFNQSCYGIDGKHGDFFTYLLLKNQIVRLQNFSHGGMFDTITRETFSAIKVVNPRIEIIEKFESMVSPIFLEMRSLQFQSDNLASLRDALLPRLISGELQIPEEMLAS